MNQASLNALSAFFGIQPYYYDFDGQLVETSTETQLALLRANGLQLDDEEMLEQAVKDHVMAEQDRWFPRELVTSAGYDYHCAFGLGANWQIILDDDLSDEDRQSAQEETLKGQAADHIILPPLPAGIHELVIDVAGRREYVLIIATPIRAPSIAEICGKDRVWGLNTALYGLRSDRNAGLGDFEDLAQLGATIREEGAAFLGINPVHSLGFSDPYTISPYSPSHRSFLNSLHIAPDRIPGLDHLPKALAILDEADEAFETLRKSEQVDYAGHRLLHNDLLRDLYTLFLQYADPRHNGAYSAFKNERGEQLKKFALYEALSEEHGTDWHRWPEPLRHQEPSAIEMELDRLAARVDFYCWIQWVADCQLSDAQSRAKHDDKALGLYLDLAVGARRGGAESWCESESVATGVSLGAPPDHLSPDGQNWGLTIFAPKRLAAEKYRALRQTYRQAMRHAGLLRIDHILGLNRSFWIPDNGAPGAYVTQPLEIFLAILAIEAAKRQYRSDR